MILIRGVFHHTITAEHIVTIGSDSIGALAGQILRHRDGPMWTFGEIMEALYAEEPVVRTILERKPPVMASVIITLRSNDVEDQPIEIGRDDYDEVPNIFLRYEDANMYEAIWLKVCELNQEALEDIVAVSKALLDRSIIW